MTLALLCYAYIHVYWCFSKTQYIWLTQLASVHVHEWYSTTRLACACRLSSEPEALNFTGHLSSQSTSASNSCWSKAQPSGVEMSLWSRVSSAKKSSGRVSGTCWHVILRTTEALCTLHWGTPKITLNPSLLCPLSGICCVRSFRKSLVRFKMFPWIQ